MDSAPSKDEGYALPEIEDPWLAGDNQLQRGFRWRGLPRRRMQPSARRWARRAAVIR